MRIAVSAPSGYNARELILPLRETIESQGDIDRVVVITPAAPWRAELFPQFDERFVFVANPNDQAGHTSLLKEHHIDVVLTPTIGLDPKDVFIIRAARANQIPSCTFVASWDNVFKMERLFAAGHSGATKHHAGAHELPDYYAVWNQMNHDHIRQLLPDVPAAHVAITGPPRFDYFAHTDRIPSRQSLLEYLGFPTDAAALLHGATTELYPFDYIIKTLAEARDQKKLVKPVHLYASVHPGGNIEAHQGYTQWGAQVRYSFGRRQRAVHPDFGYLPTDEETYLLIALFQHTDVLVNQSSTVAIESMRADRPVINVAYGKPWDWWHWRRSMVYRDFKQHYRYITEEGATTVVKTPQQLIAAVNAYLDNPALQRAERQKTITKMITYTDGSSSRRLIDFVKKIA